MKEFINLTLALIKKYRELKLPGRRKFYLNSLIFAYPVYMLCTALWMLPLILLEENGVIGLTSSIPILLIPPLVFSFVIFWFRLQKIIKKEKKDLKAKKDAIDFAKQEELKEKENLIKIKESLNELVFKDKTSFENSKRN